MALKLKGSTSGFVGLDAPSVAGNNTLILPENSGSAFQIFANDITAGVTTFTTVTVNRNGDLTVPGTISIGGTLTYEDVTSVDSIGIVTARGLSIFGNTSGLQVASGISTFQGISLSGNTSGLNVTGVSTFAGNILPSSDSSIDIGTNAVRFQNVYADTLYGDGSNLTGITQTTINSNADNRIITGSGTANTLNAESSLTYDSGGMAITGDTDRDGYKITQSGNNYGEFMFNSNRSASGAALGIIRGEWNSTEVASIYLRAADDTTNKDNGQISFYTSPNSGTGIQSRLTITSDGIIQCGTSGVLKAEINNAVSGHQFISQCSDNNNGFEVYQKHGSTTTRNTFAVYANTGSSASKELQFAVRGDGNVGINETSPTDRLHIKNTTSDKGILIKTTGNNYHTICGDANRTSSSDNILRIDSKWNGTVVNRIRMLAGADTTNKDDGIMCFDTASGGSMGERMRIDSSGRVSIGDNNTQTAYPFYVAKDLDSGGDLLSFGNTDSTYSQGLTLNFDSNKDMKWSGGSGVGGLIWSAGTRGFQMQINGTTRLNINSVGRVRLSGVPGVAGSNLSTVFIESDGNLCTQSSLREYKTNISSISDTSWLYNLNPVTFNWKKKEEVDGKNVWEDTPDGNGTQYGLIAEEVEAVKKEFCYYDNNGDLSGVHYDRLIAPLIKALQEQKTEIDALKTRVATLEGS